MDNEINAFDEGVALGGLRNTTQIKLLVEYLVSSLDEPITEEMTVQALTIHSLANYFEAVQAINELINNGSLVRDSDGYLGITPAGADSLRELLGVLPVTVREKAMADAVALQMKARINGQTSATVSPVDGGYNVNCRVLNNGKPLMELNIFAADTEQAEDIRERFLDDPARLYSAVISALYT